MVLGMSVATFTLLHVVISLIGIATGLIAMVGLLRSQPMPGWTGVFLATTILTSVTGFLFPVDQLLPSHVVGIISLVLLAVTAMTSLYLNIFVLVIQSFLKVPPLHALAPSVPPSEPPFAAVQGIVLVLFVVLTFLAVRRFRPVGGLASGA